MKNNKTMLVIIAIVVLIAIAITLCTFNISAPSNASRQYFCDYHHVSFDMNINVEDMDGNKLYNIDGEVFATYEDDLTMTDNNGNIVKHTNDIYNLITQNEHAIYNSDNELLYKCDGKIKIFADSYDIYDSDGNKIAYVNFNMFDTRGIMTDVNGNTIARYDSALSRKDYILSIYENCKIDDESVLMIFASYVSDVRADG